MYLGSSSSPPLPLIDRNKRNVLSYEGPGDEQGWALRVDEEEVRRYDTDDLRVSIVYRARCFETAEVSTAASHILHPASCILLPAS